MFYFAVTGSPILHSKSPEVFYAAFAGRSDLAYFRMAAASAGEAMRLFRELGLSGMNITAPFKAVENWGDASQTETVRILQAGNTLWRQGEGCVLANTDVDGVGGAIEAQGMDIAGEKCLVIGAGGAGRAAAYALRVKGGAVVIANRTLEKAKGVAEIVGCRYCGLEELSGEMSDAKIIVNTLYAGIEVIKEEWLQEGQVVLDAVYQGSYLKDLSFKRGVTCIDGRSWLLYQGIPAYRRFVGTDPDIDGMKKALESNRKKPLHISLVGFMGVGKTTIAPLISGRLNLPYVDVDQEIERRSGLTIPSLIKRYGEIRFREIESEVLIELLKREEATVISCGGGAVSCPENRLRLRELSWVIWLYARPEICVGRIEVPTRPLLARYADPVRAAGELFESRKSDYAQVADLLISTNDRNVEEVSEIIYGEISKVY